MKNDESRIGTANVDAKLDFIVVEVKDYEMGVLHHPAAIRISDIVYFDEFAIELRNGRKYFTGGDTFEKLKEALVAAPNVKNPSRETIERYRPKLVKCPICNSIWVDDIVDDMGNSGYQCVACGHTFTGWDL